MKTQTELLNFRMPKSLKAKFQETCKQRNTAMTSVLCEAVHDYVHNHEESVDSEWEPIVFSTHEQHEGD